MNSVKLFKMDLQRFAEDPIDMSGITDMTEGNFGGGVGDEGPKELPNPDDIFGFSNDDTYYDEFGNELPKGQKAPEQPATPEQDKPPVQEPPATPPVEQPPAGTESQGDKGPQSPEENARFAETRRQQQEQQRQLQLQQEAERLANERLANSYEAAVARRLEQMYGMPIDQIASQLEQARLAEEAQRTGVPVEFLQRQQQLEQQTQQQIAELQQRASKAEFDNWFASKSVEKTGVMQKYPMLSEAEVNEAIGATIQQFRNPQFPLERAVLALHGEKITQALSDQARQNALAEVSGRETSPLSPQGVRPNTDGPVLSPEQKQMAKAFGISEKDYIAWMDKESL